MYKFKEIFPGTSETFTSDQITAMVVGNQKISLIKALRACTPNLDLREAKDLIEAGLNSSAAEDTKTEAILDVFRSRCPDYTAEDMTKEEFMHLVDNALNHADAFFMDPLEATETLCKNIREHYGNLRELQKRYDKFAAML